ncbi:MAG: nuclear transport factor 2 family protein [Mycobacterium sp.]
MTESRLDDIERRLRMLEDERDIARLIASYGPLVDSGDADGAAALWTVDGSYDVEGWSMSGRDEIAAMVRSDAHQGLISAGCCHFFGPPVVEVSGDVAVAVCESTLLVRRESGGYAVARAGVHLLRLSREHDGWRIVSRTARQLDGGTAGRDLIAEGLAAYQDGA